ncbi:MAG TPA: hypothetical protein VGC29_11295 [Flavisolibacter sp.]
MKYLVWPLLVLLVLIFPGCRKKDLVNESLPSLTEEEGNRSNSTRNQCDFSEASSNSISLTGEPGFTSLFKKYYMPGSGKLDKILVSFRNIAAPGANDPALLKLIYRHNRIIFLNDNSLDTMAILNFDNAGKLRYAQAGLPFHFGWSLKTGFRFIYHQDKLIKIENSEQVYIGDDQYQTNWYPYINIRYDHQKKNVSEIFFPAFGAPGPSIKYEYNYSRKVKNQVYPDDMMGDYHYFLYFLKYLNLFPELTPEHLLVRSKAFNTDYPGNYDRRYSNHVVDGSGKLLFYHQNSSINDVETGVNFSNTEKWKIDWKCRHGNINHHNYQN